jgi:uncharacterized protein (TIGR00251 family)
MQGVTLEPCDDGGATLLSVRAQPGARRRGVLGTWNGHLKLGVRAPPEDGRANAELCALVAELVGLRPSAVSLLRGAASRQKVLRVELPPAEVARRLREHARPSGSGGGAGPAAPDRTGSPRA